MIEQKRIILVSVDTLRFDCIGHLSNYKALKEYKIENELKTPTLDSIAKKSICFTNAISTNPYTTASHASIITGLYPPRHGVRALYDTKLSKNVFTIAELLKNQGYLTILSTDILELWKPLDLHRGFSYIFERKDKDVYSFLDMHKDDKIFLFIHFFDVHTPYLFSEYEIFEGYNKDYYDLLKELDKKFKIGLDQIKEKPHTCWKKISEKLLNKKDIFFPLYVKGVTRFDNGRFKNFITELDFLGYLDNSLMFIFSDHGEGRCYENREFFHHGGLIYEDVIKVPLLIYNLNPWDRKIGKIIETQISMIDIFPTILEIVNDSLDKNINIPYKIDGQSLISLTNDKNVRDDRFIYSESWNLDSGLYCGDIEKGIPHIIESKRANDSIIQQRILRTKNRKYIIYGRPDIYFDKTIFDLHNKEFIRQLYRNILGRIEEKEGLEYWSKFLEMKVKTRKEVIDSFLQSEEHRIKRKFIVFNLENDPEEEDPIDPFKEPLYTLESFKFFDNILAIEKQTINTEKIFVKDLNNSDEEKIKNRLKDLGYF